MMSAFIAIFFVSGISCSPISDNTVKITTAAGISSSSDPEQFMQLRQAKPIETYIRSRSRQVQRQLGTPYRRYRYENAPYYEIPQPAARLARQRQRILMPDFTFTTTPYKSYRYRTYLSPMIPYESSPTIKYLRSSQPDLSEAEPLNSYIKIRTGSAYPPRSRCFLDALYSLFGPPTLEETGPNSISQVDKNPSLNNQISNSLPVSAPVETVPETPASSIAAKPDDSQKVIDATKPTALLPANNELPLSVVAVAPSDAVPSDIKVDEVPEKVSAEETKDESSPSPVDALGVDDGPVELPPPPSHPELPAPSDVSESDPTEKSPSNLLKTANIAN